MYRAVVAGLEAHVGTHVAASVLTRGYTPGLLTAMPVMLPGCHLAVEELEREGIWLIAADRVRGAALLVPSAVLAQVVARGAGPASALTAWFGRR